MKEYTVTILPFFNFRTLIGLKLISLKLIVPVIGVNKVIINANHILPMNLIVKMLQRPLILIGEIMVF